MCGHLFIAFVLCTVVITPSTRAQFYASSNASWCLGDGLIMDGPLVNMEITSDADTLIMGVVYNRIIEYHGPSPWHYSKRHFVRSATDGKGYLFLLDSLAEYLTGDVSAEAGDPVYQVIMASDLDECLLIGYEYRLFDVVVDSVVTRMNDGISIARHYVHEVSCYNGGNGNFDPASFFWQAGLGAFAGPVLQIRSGLSGLGLNCAVAQGETVFSPWTTPVGDPGGPTICCWPLGLSVTEVDPSRHVLVSPNPSTGLFRFTNAPGEKRILDTRGREVLVTQANEVDLSGQPPGIYTAVVITASSRQAVRLVIVR